jgi:hypothetical protein
MAAAAPPAVKPLSERLRDLVATVAGEATLTCTFLPGGRFDGRPGIVSPQYCARCNQSRMWHTVAAAVPDVVFAEAMRAQLAAGAELEAGERREEEHE